MRSMAPLKQRGLGKEPTFRWRKALFLLALHLDWGRTFFPEEMTSKMWEPKRVSHLCKQVCNNVYAEHYTVPDR